MKRMIISIKTKAIRMMMIRIRSKTNPKPQTSQSDLEGGKKELELDTASKELFITTILKTTTFNQVTLIKE